MRQQVVDFLNDAVVKRIFPGCVLGVAEICSPDDIAAFGKLTYAQDSPPVNEQTVYDVASVTKAIPVSSLALQLLEQEILELDQPIIDHIPEYRGNYREAVTIRHLLTQTLQWTFPLSQLKDMPSQMILERILTSPLGARPGEKFSYANATSILLGLVIEKAAGVRLDLLAQERFFRPLGMNRTGFSVDQSMLSETAPTEIDPWRGRVIRGEVHDESAWAMRPQFIAGSAGLFSTVPDIMKFIRMLLNGGTLDGRRYFSEKTVFRMHTNMRPATTGERTGLGWELDQPYMGSGSNPARFGKTGFTGCAVVIDPERQSGFVLLSNHTFPHRNSSREIIKTLRKELADLIFM